VKPHPPKELDAIVDKVLAYRPKSKSEAGKKRKRKAKKMMKEIRKSLSPKSHEPREH
jgi:VIT1/CCC1 family predicted Fe2+/Mn2+ transporter